MGFEL
jgi:pyruvate dehydrogenase E2 component (dihydrolipoamide acetyltransferase)